MKLYALALLATVAVAQTPAPKPAPTISYCSQTPNDHCEPAPKPAPRVADTAGYCLYLTRGCKDPTSDTKAACKRDGGNWITPSAISGTGTQKPVGDTLRLTSGPVPQTLIELSPYPNLSIGAATIAAYPAKVTAFKDFKESVDVYSQTGRVVKLSDEEYARLQKLRQAVADEEKKTAAAHGVDFGQAYVPPPCIYYDMQCIQWDWGKEVQARPANHYEFRGQWLLINVPPSAKGPR